MAGYVIPSAYKQHSDPGVPTKARIEDQAEPIVYNQFFIPPNTGKTRAELLPQAQVYPEGGDELMKLATARPKMPDPSKLLELTNPVLTTAGIVSNLGMVLADERAWAKFLDDEAGKAVNGVAFRKVVMEHARDQKLDAELRRAVMQRALMYWRGQQVEKALYIGPRGGKWADPQHTIPWDAKRHAPGRKIHVIDATAKPQKTKQEIKKKLRELLKKDPQQVVGAARAAGLGWIDMLGATRHIDLIADAIFKVQEGKAAKKESVPTKPKKPVAPQETPPVDVTETEADEIRRRVGLDINRIEAYNPKTAVEKLGKQWSVKLITGEHPGLFSTRKEAVAMATRHKEMRRDMYEDPTSYYDVVSLRAVEAVAKINQYMAEGMTEMQAGNRVKAENQEKSTKKSMPLTIDLSKAQPRGGKYHRRVPKPGGGFHYIYDADKYGERKDAHLDGEGAGQAYLSDRIARFLTGAGTKGCVPKDFKDLVEKHGAKGVAQVLRDGVNGGSLIHKAGRFYAKSGTAPKLVVKEKS